MARMAAGQLGAGHIMPGRFGPQNNAKILADLMTGLSKIKDPTERLRKARMFPGMEGELESLNISPSIRANRKSDAERMAKVMTPEAVANARDFAARLEDISRLFGGLGATFATKFGREANMFLE